MPFRPRRLIMPFLILAALGAAVFWWRDGRKVATVSFKTAKVERGTLIQTVTASGGLQPVESVDVSSQVSGLITEVAVDFNSQVKAGDVLARLDPATFQSRLSSAEAELANTRANHQLVRLNAERIRSLHQRNLVSQQELDQSIAQLAQADAQLLIRTAAVETAKVDLARCVITAPIDGMILDRVASAGRTVSASTSAPLLFVLVNDLRQMQIQAAVSEADISSIREGQTVNFTVDAYPGQPFRGTVRQIRNSPTREQNVVSYTTVIDVRNDDLRLKPGMTADVAIVIQERTGVLLVANAALRARVPQELVLPVVAGPDAPVAPSGWAAKAAPPSSGASRTVHQVAGTHERPRAQAVVARFGITDGVRTEVVSGLAEGDSVITSTIGGEERAAAPSTSGGLFGAPAGGGGGRRF
ncbi:MAG: efflux RND transporter periplasmic adaptor subunit [Verrucomicrobia bacterium]|nr:MAG: efflux RND transporter periplasmic adaptor subunit [Verrucomicrobiota bacterium]